MNYPPYDFTYLYNSIYEALKKMEPHIIGGLEDECYEQFVRRFKLALYLADSLRKDSFWPRKKHWKAVRILHKILSKESSYWWV